MSAGTKKVALIYGAWGLLGICLALFGTVSRSHAEYAISAQLWLLLTGLPLSLVSLAIHPNGTLLGVVVAALAGWIQWSAVAAANAWWDNRQEKRKR